ncbi:hypothetical protein CTA1_11258 [Colletotrichum tanaceti]|uniref:Uncharacterized protein n=1 Tax=Colletotrichum tanaceti TaxID=1306861 RepID=A0A4U6XCA3_9PEZI|nr:hypothetical protein CTA1_11258 [Colletotrichum tanaceti]
MIQRGLRPGLQIPVDPADVLVPGRFRGLVGQTVDVDRLREERAAVPPPGQPRELRRVRPLGEVDDGRRPRVLPGPQRPGLDVRQAARDAVLVRQRPRHLVDGLVPPRRDVEDVALDRGPVRVRGDGDVGLGAVVHVEGVHDGARRRRQEERPALGGGPGRDVEEGLVEARGAAVDVGGPDEDGGEDVGVVKDADGVRRPVGQEGDRVDGGLLRVRRQAGGSVVVRADAVVLAAGAEDDEGLPAAAAAGRREGAAAAAAAAAAAGRAQGPEEPDRVPVVGDVVGEVLGDRDDGVEGRGEVVLDRCVGGAIVDGADDGDDLLPGERRGGRGGPDEAVRRPPGRDEGARNGVADVAVGAGNKDGFRRHDRFVAWLWGGSRCLSFLKPSYPGFRSFLY